MVSAWFWFGIGVYVKQPLKLPVMSAEIQAPIPKKILSKSCMFSVQLLVSVRFRRICERAHRV